MKLMMGEKWRLKKRHVKNNIKQQKQIANDGKASEQLKEQETNPMFIEKIDP